MPNLHVLTTSCVYPELRFLPSTGITRFRQYYEPLRHPRVPGLSLAGVRLIIPDHTKGLPVLRTLSLCTCCRHYPGTATGGTTLLIHPAVSAFPEAATGSACASSFSRLARRSLALRPAHSRCHQFVTLFTRRLQPLRYLHSCSGCFRLEHFGRVGFAPTGLAPPLHGARRILPVARRIFLCPLFTRKQSDGLCHAKGPRPTATVITTSRNWTFNVAHEPSDSMCVLGNQLVLRRITYGFFRNLK